MPKPDFSYEKIYWKRGCHFVIGVDEVGRGAFAGPVVAAAAGLKSLKLIANRLKTEGNILNLGIDDSKRLSPQKREQLDPLIKKYFHLGIGEASVYEINRYGIVKAVEKAMREAIKKLIMQECKNERMFLLIDGFRVKYIPGIGLKNQMGIIRGDQKSISIAAASIIAKVYRDSLMAKLSKGFDKYNWSKNKGYGTKEHREAIAKYGVCNLHREKYIDNLF